MLIYEKLSSFWLLVAGCWLIAIDSRLQARSQKREARGLDVEPLNLPTLNP
jgi:hypothetical protein